MAPHRDDRAVGAAAPLKGPRHPHLVALLHFLRMVVGDAVDGSDFYDVQRIQMAEDEQWLLGRGRHPLRYSRLTPYSAIVDWLSASKILRERATDPVARVCLAIEDHRTHLGRRHIPFFEELLKRHRGPLVDWVHARILQNQYLANAWRTRVEVIQAIGSQQMQLAQYFRTVA